MQVTKMCYVLTDNNFYIGKAFTFKTVAAADNFLRCIPEAIKSFFQS